ncbi:hypothetical protein RND81_08G085600 [Saponaria officinalis]
MNMSPEKIAVQLEREMEKRKIREEIIASEIRHRRELENEVRMELLMESHILGMRNFNGFYNVDHNSMLTKYRVSGSRFRPNYDEHLLNLGTSDDLIGEKMNLISSTDNNVSGIEGMQQMEDVSLGKWPFDRDPSYVAAHVPEKFNSDLVDEDMSEAMSTAGIIGVKRKAEMPPRACEKDTSPPTMSTKWFCSVCGVSTTSEVTLNAHFQGKKHKAKEARFKATNSTNTISMGGDSLLPVSTLNSKQEKWECSLCQVSACSEMLLRSHFQGKKHKAKEAKLHSGEITVNIDGVLGEKSQEVLSVSSSNENATETDKQWYCSLCGVSASSENNLNDHLKGKKHKAKAGLPQQGIENMNHESTEKVSEVEVMKESSLDKVEIPKHEPKTSNLNTELSKDEETELNVADNSSKTKSDANRSSGLGATSDVGDAKRGVTEGNEQDPEELEKEGGLRMEFVKYWHCKMCDKGTRDEATMTAHRKSNEHMTLLKKHGGGLITVASIPKNALESGGRSRDEPSN